MKALSVIMPWPWFIMKYGKDVENRTWYTNYRGRILIHVSKKPDPYYLTIVKKYSADPVLTEKQKEEFRYLNAALCGCIIGTVEIVDCVQNYSSQWAEPGMWHWVLQKPELFKEPIPARGSLGLWEYGGEMIKGLNDA